MYKRFIPHVCDKCKNRLWLITGCTSKKDKTKLKELTKENKQNNYVFINKSVYGVYRCRDCFKRKKIKKI